MNVLSQRMAYFTAGGTMSAKLQLSYPDILRLFGTHAVKQRTESRQFLAWFLENYYRLEESEIDDCICDGNYDKGVDGVYVNEQLAQRYFQRRTLCVERSTVAQKDESQQRH
jgi:hypothetical protein